MQKKLTHNIVLIMAMLLCSGFYAIAGWGAKLNIQDKVSYTTNTFVDRSHHKIVIKKPFKRIISLYGAHTENLFSLGLDKEIIGVSKNEAYPPQASTKTIFSYHDDAEKFLNARPDLVLIRPMIARGYQNLIARLRESEIVVVSLQPNTVDGIFSYWEKLGMLTGKHKKAKQMIERFKKGVLKIHSIVKSIPPSKRKRVYFESIHRKMATFSPSSIAIFALKTAGGINIASDAETVRSTNIADYGKEHILSHANEIDVYLAQKGAMNHISKRRIMEEGGFRAIKAVKTGQIYTIDEKIVSRPTLRLLDGIYEIGRILYPTKFNDVQSFKKIPIITRAQFAEMFIKMMNIRLKTPDYYHDIKKRSDIKHKYGEYKDVDYTGNNYKYIETAVYRGLFFDAGKYQFNPDVPITRKDVAYSLFVYFDLPEVPAFKIKDVNLSDPLFEEIKTVVGLHIMKLSNDGSFGEDKPLSGKELLNIMKRAKKEATLNQNGWSKYSLATLVHENTDCTFSDSRGCIFTVNQHGWPKCSVAALGDKNRHYNP